MVEACGLVQTIEGGECAEGATPATKNTAEMQALIEALFWLNTCAEHKGLPSSGKVMITVDPLYVKGLIDEKFVEKENRTLATLLEKVTQKKLKLQIRWVRGHIRDVGNSIADLGTRADSQHRWWKRVQPMDDWEENVFQAKILSPQRERAPCEQARCIQWTGAVDLPRINPMIQVQTPQVTLGRKMGFCKKTKFIPRSTGRHDG